MIIAHKQEESQQLQFESLAAIPTIWVGLMWFDRSSISTTEKITRGANYYFSKYGHSPTVVIVHPTTPVDTSNKSIFVKTSYSVLPNNFWFGDFQGSPGQPIAMEKS